MKAERRHELKENELARQAARVVKVMQMPDLRRKYLGRAVLALVAVLVVVAVILHRINASHEAAVVAGDYLARARRVVQFDLPNAALSSATLDDAFYNRLGALAEQAQSDTEKVVTISGDPKLLAQAALLRGDLAFALANVPAPSPTTAATKPVTGLKTKAEDYLAQATAAYQEVVDKYSDQALNVVSAQFGLAAVAQNKRDWTAAQAQYKAIVDGKDTPPSLRRRAEQLRDALSNVQKAPLLVQGAIEPLVTPTTAPAVPAATQAAAKELPVEPAATQAAARGATTRPAATTRPTTTE
jgi:hypothetical protein